MKIDYSEKLYECKSYYFSADFKGNFNLEACC